MPDGHRSFSPELRTEGEMSEVGIDDADLCKTSPVTSSLNTTVEHSVAPLVTPSQVAAACQLSISTDCDAVSAVESVHSDYKKCIPPNESSSQFPVTASSEVSSADAKPARSGRKKKKRRSPVFDVSPKDIREVDVKEGGKDKQNDCVNDGDEKAYDPGNTGPKESDSSRIEDASHSGNKTRQRKKGSSSKHRQTADDEVNLEHTSRKKKTKSDEISAFRSLDDIIRANASGSTSKFIRQYRHHDDVREHACNKTSTSYKKPEKTSVRVHS